MVFPRPVSGLDPPMRPWKLDARPRSHAVGALATMAVLLSSYGYAQGSGVQPAVSKMKLFDQHIQHIVFIMQENHAYDNLFGTYCRGLNSYCTSVGNGTPSNVCLPRILSMPMLGCVSPFRFTNSQLALPTDIPHDWNSTHRTYNNGLMNGFPTYDGVYSMGYYDGYTVPVYWDLAEQYALGDNFFSPAASYSWPNHWNAISSGAPNGSYLIKPAVANAKQQRELLNQSNSTPAIEDALLNSSITWKYYDYSLPTSYNQSITHTPTGLAYDYWNPMAARNQSYSAQAMTHFVNHSKFLLDAANGSLPDISWVMPSAPNSDHPPYNITNGQNWVASLIDAVEGSPDWNTTAIFVSWDEYGGFYDHVKPPRVNGLGDGYRVPLLAIGPWVRQGFIDHTNMTFESILHLMEKRFHLGCMGPADCNAPLPLDVFNFNRKAPRAPIYFASYPNATYPMPLQSSGTLPPFPSVLSPVPSFPDLAPGATLANIDWD